MIVANSATAAGRLAGKIALVTGSGGGIGRQIALRFAREGAVVVVSDVDVLAAESTRDAILEDKGEALCFELDIAREEDWTDVFEKVRAQRGAIDVLVNNAGVALGGPIYETSLEDWRWVMSVNLDGTFLGVRTAIRHMRAGHGGAIVNISSVLADVGRPLIGAVAASKAGVASLTKTAALECAHRGWNIRVNAVLPGGVDTPIFRGQSWWPDQHVNTGREAAARQDILGDTPMKRLARPEEVAGAVVYLASDEASFVTGASLVIDGGFSAG